MIEYMVRFWEYTENIMSYDVRGEVLPRIGEIVRVSAYKGEVTGIIHVNSGISNKMKQIVDVELHHGDDN